MDFGFTEEQEMLRKMARDFLATECPKKLVRDMEEDDRGYSPELWKKMADLGWLGLVLPEKYGGTAGNFLDLAILSEEMGRALLPAPFLSTALAGLAINEVGTDAQKEKLLPRISSGELIVALAITEPSARWDKAGIEVSAKVADGGYAITGTKLFIQDAHIADYLLTPVRTRRGVTIFLVDGKAPGISCTLLKTIASDKQCEVEFQGVRVPRENILGEVDKGWPVVEKLITWGAVSKCAEMVGGAQQVLDMTVQYAKDRIQFGRPIGSFQAIQHHCANMAIDTDGCRYITYEAAWRLSQGLPCTLEASMAKGWVSEAYRRVCAISHQVHGGIGFTKDHDLQLYFRRAKAAELFFGDGDFHREAVAKSIGL